jgi:prephenate dehydrogenase
MPRSVLIAGLGLIGGAAGMALRARGWQVTYVDPYVSEDEAREAAAADGRGAIDGGHDLIVLATPVNVAAKLLVGPLARSRSAITSVCSVMGPLRASASGVNFVAGHPLAGSERRGLGAARADLFEGRKWFVDGDDDAVDALIHDCGARKIRVTAEEHDAAVALTSHLPQVLSTALAAALTNDDVDRFAGAGLETFLRLAGSDSTVWAPILEANRDNIRAHFDRVVAIAGRLIDADPAETFRLANEVANSLNRKSHLR